MCMIKKLTSSLSIFKNLDKIKEILSSAYFAIVNTLATLTFLENQLNDTKLGTILKNYLPKTIEVLSKIKQIFEKYGYLANLKISTEAQAISEENLLQQLTHSSKQLDEFLK